MPFSIDENAFAAWVADESDELPHHLPDPTDTSARSTSSELVHRALSAGALIGDPGLELNIHDATIAEETGYVVRLNNRAGSQLSVGLTRGWNELRWPPKDFTVSDEVRYCLQQICDTANALLNDILVVPA
ncbi:hypothetical protein [Mycobacterium attenuatum]|uniref:hypothetical protein n=1 Tax=Mycobacterium attenuatum TaxID=2341086 RepID=UPI0010A9613C|nr:hypothetical protein [Mycobacterium attenuatum]